MQTVVSRVVMGGFPVEGCVNQKFKSVERPCESVAAGGGQGVKIIRRSSIVNNNPVIIVT